MSASPTRLPIASSNETFEVKRIICVGRNYAEHTKEMGHDPDREPPFFFFKPVSALLPANTPFQLPAFSREIHHEVELLVAVNQKGYQLTPKQAAQSVAGFGVGLDMTARDVQNEAKKLGRPWDISKGFDGSAICSSIEKFPYPHMHNYQAIRCYRNGDIVQQSNLSSMIWPVPELISAFSQFMNIQPGDLFFTGTPAGVGEVKTGDSLRAEIDGMSVDLAVDIA
ncbi:MAG: fumarylacetoacetate hydrolase [Alteromonadaceae bacterium]|nr:MAG: fumarylacetoacetate hydrolase [Alteromonadaceae bacterium]